MCHQIPYWRKFSTSLKIIFLFKGTLGNSELISPKNTSSIIHLCPRGNYHEGYTSRLLPYAKRSCVHLAGMSGAKKWSHLGWYRQGKWFVTWSALLRHLTYMYFVTIFWRHRKGKQNCHQLLPNLKRLVELTMIYLHNGIGYDRKEEQRRSLGTGREGVISKI